MPNSELVGCKWHGIPVLMFTYSPIPCSKKNMGSLWWRVEWRNKWQTCSRTKQKLSVPENCQLASTRCSQRTADWTAITKRFRVERELTNPALYLIYQPPLRCCNCCKSSPNICLHTITSCIHTPWFQFPQRHPKQSRSCPPIEDIKEDTPGFPWVLRGRYRWKFGKMGWIENERNQCGQFVNFQHKHISLFCSFSSFAWPLGLTK